ncbi:MAG: adenylate kinase [Planctomycetes bacterium]|jgi:adenylate kinase|nr:adenylate kinase [Planctomycetota bacterium]MDA8378208.1 adenylate kinase [Planctomycetia bacterium]
MRLALLGPPGAGKGTQAVRLAHRLRVTHLSSGDILRSEKSAGTALGMQIRDFIDHGKLVPDALMIRLMENRIAQAPGGFVLDGFPRTLVQAQELARFLDSIRRPLDVVVNFVLDEAILSRRFEGRRVCPVCGSVYHLDTMPPEVPGLCDQDGQALVIRPDDQPEVVKERINTYRRSVEPLVAFYEQKGILVTLNAAGTPNEVTAAVLKLLQDRGAGKNV